MGSSELLFTPGHIGGLRLENRVILSPMSTLLCEDDGTVNDALIDWYARRAAGGAGLVVVEAAQVATKVDIFRIWSNALLADDDSCVPGLTALASAVHKAGARIGIQISPGAGAQAAGGPWVAGSEATAQPVSPSGISALHSTRRTRSLEVEEIETVIESCAEAVLRVKRCGFDLVNLHGHGGYLLAQFLSPYFNRRTDRYGGTEEKRFRFLLEMIEAARAKVGAEYPITVKYSIDEYIPGGRGVQESQRLARKLEAAGADGIFIAVGTHGSKNPIVPPHFVPAGSHLPLAQAIKAVVKTPVIVAGRLNEPRFAERVLRDGKADFIALGRALIADPDWPRKVRAGQVKEIRPCLACNVCRQRLFTSEPIRCAINAAAGKEASLGAIAPATVRKKVLIVGGGPAGLEAARIAGLRGHSVVLCEKTRRLGGMLNLAGVFNREIPPFLRWLKAQIRRLPVEVRLSTECSRALVEELKPDAIIFATGGEFVELRVAGAERSNVFGGQDLLNLVRGVPVRKTLLLRALGPFISRFFSPALARYVLDTDLLVGRRVVVVGGQLSGGKLALHLALSGKKVTILESSPQYGHDMEETTMDALRNEIEGGNVSVLTSAKIEEITRAGVVVADTQGQRSVVEADTVMVALGIGPHPVPVATELKGTVGEVFVIGDVEGFRGIRDAVADGYVTAYGL